MRRLAALLVVILGVAACSNDPGSIDPRACAATVVTAPRPVSGDAIPIRRLTGANPHAAAVATSQAMFECTTDVVVVDTADLDRIALAATLAADLKAPLLFGEEGHTAHFDSEVERLTPQRAWFVGELAAGRTPPWTEVIRLRGDQTELAERIAAEIGASDRRAFPPGATRVTVAATIDAILGGTALFPPGEGVAPAVTLAAEDDVVVGTAESGLVWLVDDTELPAALAAAAAVVTSNGFMGLVTGSDLRHDLALSADLQPIVDRVRAVQIVGATEDARWQVQVLLRGDQLPGGGFLVLPRRIVALYGNPLTTSLGPLGHQGPEESVRRIRELSAGYDADGVQVIPGFEIITTVAAGNPGNDGNYSNEMEVDLIRTWVDVAGRNGVYVLLDLQPGRTDFLTQAKLYEELLLEPHVGLALDPEWRLKPDELHLEQIGGVEAAEVNEVIDWLAALTRDNALPQKVLLLHQFWPTMLPDRDQIRGTPELQLVIQMDGHGTIPEKMTTWERTTAGWETDPFAYGWKNFFTQDFPAPLGPAEILELVPTVVFISFQ